MAGQVRINSESGVAVIAVLWTTILLSMLATALIMMSRSDARLLSAERARLQVGESAQAAINIALVALSDPKGGWPMDGTPQVVKFGDIDTQVSVSAESGKIDLNIGSPELIRGLLMVAGAGPGNADKMTAAIMERRVNTNGFGGNSNIGQGIQFRSIGELAQIPGVTRDLFDRLAPNLTLYSGSPSVEADFASSDVLLAIPGNTRADTEAALRQRSFSGAGPNGNADLSRIIGQAFTVSARSQSLNSVVMHKTEIVRVIANSTQPIWVLAIR